MFEIIAILGIISGLAWFVFDIMVLIKLFQEKGVEHGILGMICGLYTFIWGWSNADRLNIRKTMIYWSIATVVMVICNTALDELR